MTLYERLVSVVERLHESAPGLKPAMAGTLKYFLASKLITLICSQIALSFDVFLKTSQRVLVSLEEYILIGE